MDDGGRSANMNIKLNPLVNIRTLLLATPLLVSGCQMLNDAAAAGHEVEFERGSTTFLTTNTHIVRGMQMAEDRMMAYNKQAPVPTLAKPVSPAVANAAWVDLGAIANKSIQIAEDKAENNHADAIRRQAELWRMVERQFRN